MIDLKEIINQLEETNIEERTTKELKEYGLNDYYIKKAIQEGKIKKIERGKYQITKITKDKNKQQTFKLFTKNIINGKFEEAYKSLCINLQNQTTHDYDNHLMLYFILLKEILQSPKDFPSLNNLMIFSEKDYHTGSYYKYFINFSEAVLSHDFENAYSSISEFKNLERERKNKNNISTELFFILTNQIILSKNKNSQQKKEQINQKIKQDNEKKFHFYYKLFEKNIDKENYEEALNNLHEIAIYAHPHMEKAIKNFIQIINNYLEIKKNNQLLPEKEIDYKDLDNNYTKILDRALSLNDFQTAYKNIGKCIYFNPNNKILISYRSLLQKLIHQNKENQQKINSTKNNCNLENKKEQFSIQDIAQLINKREYEQVKNILEEKLNQEYNNTYSLALKLIKTMEKIKSTGTVYQEKNPTYTYTEQNPIKRFFESIKFKDYQEAYYLTFTCEKIARNKEEFTIFRYLLEDILECINQLEKEKLRKEKLTEINHKIDSFVKNKELMENQLNTLEELIKEKLELCKEEEITYNQYTLELIDTLKRSKEENITISNFEQFTYEEKDIEKKFFKALSIGDYIQALNIIKEKKLPYNSNFSLYKSLLIELDKQLKNNEQTPANNKELELQDENPTIKHLNTLKKLLKEKNYLDAYLYYQNNNLEGISINLTVELKTILTFLKQFETNEAIELLKEYKKSYNRGDLEQATLKLQQYQEFIANNTQNRNIDYHQSRLSILKEDINNPTFVKKEQLYDTARYYYQEKEYQKSINIIDLYIQIDNDLNAKGYLLKGRNHEHLKQYKEAQENYQKAISIIPEPNAYFRLGKVYLYNHEYDQAKNCFLEYEKRRPGYHNSNLKALVECYNLLGEDHLSEDYKKLIKINSKNGK